MIISAELLRISLTFLLVAAVSSFIWAPLLIRFLNKYKITRRNEYDFTLHGERQHKIGTPIMGGLLIVLTVAAITIAFNWERKFTYVPIGVMGVSALLGAADDLLNIFGRKRRVHHLKHTLTLVRVHKKWYMRLAYACTLPWALFRELGHIIGSHPGRGIQPHEKLLFQFVAGAITAAWVYFKLGTSWHTLWIPFDGQVDVGWLIIPIIIFLLMFTANAVNVADGLDGLAGGSLIIAFSALTLLSWLEGRTAFAPLNATVVGALLTYTYFNVKPARFQMGDVGSLGLGALLAINALAINRALLLPLLGFIFYAEIISVMAQVGYRHLRGKRLLAMAPLHHHFEFKGWSEEKIVMRFWLIQAFMVILAIWIAVR